MAVISVFPPFPAFHDSEGEPLEGGQIYIGAAGQNPFISANQLAVYADSALTIPIAQPIRTSGGYPVNESGSAARIYAGAADYSIGVRLSNGALVSSSLSNKTKLGLIDLSTDVTGLLLSTFIKYDITAAEIAALVTPTNYDYRPGYIQRYKAGSLLTDASNDWSAALSDACKQSIAGGATVMIPAPTVAGFYRFNSTINLTNGCKIRPDGGQPSLRFYGCAGIVCAAGANNLDIDGFEYFSLSGAGVVDPRAYTGISMPSTPGAHSNYMFLSSLYMRGWDRCINAEYVWNSCIDNITTLNCNVDVRYFGQCVTNFITRGRLNANGGTHSIQMVKDGPTRGEGLYISGTLFALGQYGMQSDGWLGVHISSFEADGILDTCFDLTNVNALDISGWVFGVNYGIRFRDLGVLVNQQASISKARVETTAANSIPIAIGANNSGVSIVGGSLTCAATGTSRDLFIEAFTTDVDVVMLGVNLVNPSANPSCFIGSPGFRHNGLTGNVTISYFAPDKFLGTLTNVTGTVTADIVYTEHGDCITLQIPQIIGASPNVNPPSITGMPANIRPLTQQWPGWVTSLNNSVEVGSKIAVETSGNLTIYNGISTAFTAAGNKGLSPNTITYRRF